MSTYNKVIEKNKKDWNHYSEKWSAFNHSEKILRPILEDPSKAFHRKTWEMIQKYIPDFTGSGDAYHPAAIILPYSLVLDWAQQ